MEKKSNQYEILLRESEERYRSVLNVSPDAIIIHFEGKIVYANSNAIEKIGAKKLEEIVGKPAIEFVHPDDREAAIKRIGEMYKSNKPAPLYEERMLKTDGSVLYVELAATLIPYEGGNASFVVLRDISERKKAVEALKEYKELFSLFMQYSPVYTFIKEVSSTESRVLQASDNFKEMVGITGPEMIGKTMEELFPADFAKKISADDWDVIKKGEILHVDEDLNDRNYTTIKFPIKQGERNLLAGFTIDITKRKKAELELQQSYDLLHKLTAMVPGVVYQYRLYPDGSSAFPISSSGMWDIYEVTPEEVKEDASPVFTRIHPDDYDMIVETISESAQNLTLYHSEFRVILPKQGLRWRLCDAKPERLEDGSTLWHGIITDITERKQAEEELIKYRNHLEELVKERTADLEQKNIELEKFNELFVGREFRIKELKDKVKKLELQIQNK